MNIDFTSQPNALPAPSQQPFGLVIPGRPVRTDFSPVDATNLRFALRLTCPGDINGPLISIRELVFFTLTALPPDQGVLVYWQIAAAADPTNNTTGFELLGSITANSPSQVFSTGWSEHEQVTNISALNVPLVITIGASVEPLSSIENLATSGLQINTSKLFVAQKIAMDLFNFMKSFDTGVAGNGFMTVPTNIFDRWFKRFENRFNRDPNFFLKSND